MQLTLTQRVRKSCHLAHAVDGTRQLVGIQLQPCHQSWCQPLGG